MKIAKTIIDKTCDCGNKACYEISHKYKIINFKIYVCTNCLTELYKQMGINLIPASPTNVIKKASRFI